jgi:hypothetical protein
MWFVGILHPQLNFISTITTPADLFLASSPGAGNCLLHHWHRSDLRADSTCLWAGCAFLEGTVLFKALFAGDVVLFWAVHAWQMLDCRGFLWLQQCQRVHKWPWPVNFVTGPATYCCTNIQCHSVLDVQQNAWCGECFACWVLAGHSLV